MKVVANSPACLYQQILLERHRAWLAGPVPANREDAYMDRLEPLWDLLGAGERKRVRLYGSYLNREVKDINDDVNFMG
jgi:hypothetical protein